MNEDEGYEEELVDQDATLEEEDAAPGKGAPSRGPRLSGGRVRITPGFREGENKIFVGGIKTLDQERFNEYFSLYGELVDSVVMVDKATGKSRGFGFVQYASAESAERVMEDYDAHSIDGLKFEVKRCVPKGLEAGNGPAHPARATRAPAPVQRAPRPTSAARPAPAAWGPPLGHWRPPRQPVFAPEPYSPMMTDKVFVGGVGECREDLFIDYFSPYGHIIDVVVMRDKATQKSRGFGFVQFDHPQAVDAIMQHGQPRHVDGRMVEVSQAHFLNGRQVEVKRSIPKEVMAGAHAPAPHFAPAPAPHLPAAPYALARFGPPPAQHAPPRRVLTPRPAPMPQAASPRAPRGSRVDKVFVGGLGEATEEEFVEYFSQFGTLVDHVVMVDKATGKSRGFGFVTYDDPAAVDEIMGRYSEHQIGGKWIEVKRTIPEEKGGGKGAKGVKGGGKGFRSSPY